MEDNLTLKECGTARKLALLFLINTPYIYNKTAIGQFRIEPMAVLLFRYLIASNVFSSWAMLDMSMCIQTMQWLPLIMR